MKVISFTCLHYGTDYLGWALRSVIDHVNEAHVIYSPVGSHGHHTDRKCPDTRDELYAIAWGAARDKLRWTEGTFRHEGEHRSHIHTVAPDADVILVVDADEIWADGLAAEIIDSLERKAGWGEVLRTIRVPIIHYWRSFYRAILHDPAYPVRVIQPRNKESNEGYWHTEKRINHMGYAQSPAIVEYKQHTHGHKGEWDWSWFDNVFMTNRQTDTHPVGSEWWQPETVNPWDYLPEWMKLHPYANMQVIE